MVNLRVPYRLGEARRLARSYKTSYLSLPTCYYPRLRIQVMRVETIPRPAVAVSWHVLRH